MTKIKICGLSREKDIDIANELLPDYVGFVFAKSKRQVSAEQARKLKDRLSPQIKAVGVFVNEKAETIAEIVSKGIIDLVQLHGDEDAAYCRELRKLTEAPIIKAVRLKDESSLTGIEEFTCDYYLFDTYSEQDYGGTGKSFNQEILLNKKIDKPYFIAGGLNAANVAAVIKDIRPYAVDVSGGVETDGVKDKAKIEEFINRGRAVGKMSKGRYGIHGGQYLPETLMNAVLELERAYEKHKNDPAFLEELQALYRDYANRPSLLYYAEKMTKDLGGAKIYLKREDLNHTGSHKINNVLGQVLLAKKMGKKRVIAETGAGQHGVATATVAALMGMECVVYMGKEDTERQALNVFRMELLGAKVVPVETGTMTLKDAVNEAMRVWTSRVDDTFYVLGSVMGPHPYPEMVRDFQSVIGKEVKKQMLAKEGRLPDVLLACVGGGSNAMGLFYDFIPDKEVRLIGVEAAGRGVETEETAATISRGSLGIFHGMKSYFLQDEYGQIAPVYSISAGLDYPGIGPEHASLHDAGRAEYVPATDDEAVAAFSYLSKTEGIIPAIESAHAVAYAMKIAPQMDKDKIMVINLSGRGDKDVAAIARYMGVDLHE